MITAPCLHWSRALPHGPGTCSLGQFSGKPYVGNCDACPHYYPPDKPSAPGESNLLMTYDTGNLGDDIQATAVAALMPGITGTVLRSRLARHQVAGRILISGWFADRAAEWPPAPVLTPTFLSFHAHDDSAVAAHTDYLRAHAPIACRDLATVELCQQHGIGAWFAGCVTLTLQSLCTPPAAARPLTVDFPIDGVENLTQHIGPKTPNRMALARARIDRLAQARCVVTSRLHTALPCAALGIPVLLIHPADKRFTGLDQLVHYSPAPDPQRIREFLADPQPNPLPDLLHTLARGLRDRARSLFAGAPAGYDVAGWAKLTRLADPATVGRWQETAPARHDLQPLPSPEFWGASRDAAYRPYQITHIPARGVLDVAGGVIATDQCTPVFGDSILADLTWFSGQRSAKLPLPLIYTTPRQLRGRTLSLGSEWSRCNFGHWLLDSFGRLAVLRQAGRSIDEFDQIILPMFHSPDAQRIAARAGLTGPRIIDIPGKTGALQCEHLTVPSFAGVSCAYSPDLIAYLRDLLQAPQWWTAPGPRVYVRRGRHGRRMPQEPAMEAIAKKHRFLIVDPKAAGALEIIATASIIVGAHGAGLSSIAFARPGAQICELIPDGHQQLYYRSIAEAGGLRYSALMVSSQGAQRGLPFGMICQSGVHVDLVKFEHVICSLITQP